MLFFFGGCMKTTDTGTNNICQVKDGAETAGRVMIRSNALICGLFSASLAETKLMIMAMYFETLEQELLDSWPQT